MGAVRQSNPAGSDGAAPHTEYTSQMSSILCKRPSQNKGPGDLALFLLSRLRRVQNVELIEYHHDNCMAAEENAHGG